MAADHTPAPVLEALAAYGREGRLAFTPPGHKQARGADPAVREVLGDAVFHGDVLVTAGLGAPAHPGAGTFLARRQSLMRWAETRTG
ncbi:hypothetical protein ABZ344_32130, partial [Streptomyces olivaceus]